MNTEIITQIFPLLKDISKNQMPMALGGYPALVRQGILKEKRDSKDIDICMFLPEGVNLFESYFKSMCFDWISDWQKLMAFHSNDEVRSTMFRLAYSDKARSGREEEDDLGEGNGGESPEYQEDVDLASNQAKNLKNKLGVNKTASIEIIKTSCHPKTLANALSVIRCGQLNSLQKYITEGMRKKIQYEDEERKSGAKLPFERDHREVSEIVSSIAWNCRTIKEATNLAHEIAQTMSEKGLYSYLTRWGWLPELILNVSKAKSSMDVEPIKLMQIMNATNMKSLKVDMFLMDFDRINRASVEIDGIRYVHFYTILKAKHEYCLNPRTDDASFNKHIADLEESFLAKKIKGVNWPEDIDYLRVNRLNLRESVLREDAEKRAIYKEKFESHRRATQSFDISNNTTHVVAGYSGISINTSASL